MEETNLYNYYGDTVRGLFMFAGVLMVITLPFFSSLVHMPVTISLIGILALAILSGFLNPVQKWIIVIDTCVSAIAFVTFEYYAVDTYLHVAPTLPSGIYF